MQKRVDIKVNERKDIGIYLGKRKSWASQERERKEPSRQMQRAEDG